LANTNLKGISSAKLLMGANMDVYRKVLYNLITLDFLPLVAFRCKVEEGYFHDLPLFFGTDEEEYTNSMYSIPTLLAFEVSLSSGFGMTDFFLRLSKGKLSKN